MRRRPLSRCASVRRDRLGARRGRSRRRQRKRESDRRPLPHHGARRTRFHPLPSRHRPRSTDPGRNRGGIAPRPSGRSGRTRAGRRSDRVPVLDRAPPPGPDAISISTGAAPVPSNLIALSTRFEIARSRPAGGPRPRSSSASTHHRAAGPASCPFGDDGRDLGEVDRRGGSSDRRSVARSTSSSTSVDNSRASLSRSASRRVRSSGRQVVVEPQHVDVGAQAGQRRPELVAGILGESLLVGLRRGQRTEHAVEGTGQPTGLIAPLARHRGVEPSRGRDRLGRVGQPTQPHGHLASEEPADGGGDRHHDRVAIAMRSRRRASTRSFSSSDRAICTAPRPDRARW